MVCYGGQINFFDVITLFNAIIQRLCISAQEDFVWLTGDWWHGLKDCAGPLPQLLVMPPPPSPLSWLIAEMLDGQHKMEEAADTSSAGPLEACLFSDNPNWHDGALRPPQEAVAADA